jgi:hypothetical protein
VKRMHSVTKGLTTLESRKGFGIGDSIVFSWAFIVLLLRDGAESPKANKRAYIFAIAHCRKQ